MGVTAAGLTASPAGQVPVVGGAVVTWQADDVGLTLALAGRPLTHTVLSLHALAAVGPQEVTRAL